VTSRNSDSSTGLINSIGNLGGFVGPCAIGWIKDATGEIALGLVVLAACSIMAGVVTFLMGHDSKNGDGGQPRDGGVSRNDCATQLWL
jgi:ACS family tartrate transporter-like MFS transporter